ncbi:hypothetical protein FRB99_000147 [Tulasnella sp. 403]|nr:hypothetical protein FRB99_000147 [Tulasnella sp. 403]
MVGITRWLRYAWIKATGTVRDAAPEAAAVIETIIRLGNAAQLPLCGSAFSIALEIFNMVNAVRSAQDARKELLQTIEEYAERIGVFVEAMSAEYIQTSDDLQARIARAAILKFEESLTNVRDDIAASLRRRGIRRWLAVTSVDNELRQWAQKLVEARRRFNDDVSNISVADHRLLRTTNARPTDLRVACATPLAPNSPRLRDTIHMSESSTFWADAFCVEVEGQPVVMKVYTKRAGGEQAFRRDLTSLADNFFAGVPKVYGYCADSRPPFIIFTHSSVKGLKKYFIEFGENDPKSAVVKAWGLLVDMQKATQYVIDNDDNWNPAILQDALEDVVVDQNGKALLVPTDRRNQAADKLNWNAAHLVAATWSFFLTYCPVRAFRSLGLALHTNETDMLLHDWEKYEDSDTAIGTLRKWWGSPAQRRLPWPIRLEPTVSEECHLGDVGYFDAASAEVGTFRKVGSLLEELGGVRLTCNLKPGMEFVQRDVIRMVFQPQQNGPIVYTCHIVYNLISSDDEWTFFSRQVRHLGEVSKVAPHDLVLVTETHADVFVWGPREYMASLHEPVYLFLHLHQLAKGVSYYWSKDPVFHPSKLDKPDPSVPIPDHEIQPPIPRYFIQLEPSEIIQSDPLCL